MEFGAVVFIGLFALSVAVPIALIFWARSAQMYSGAEESYDGPLVEVNDFGTDRVEVDEGVTEGLSQDEQRVWDELTKVSWNLPSERS